MEPDQTPKIRPKRPLPAIVQALVATVFILAIGLILGAWEGYSRINALSHRVALLEANVATTTNELQKGLEQTHDALSTALQQEQEKASNLQTQFGTISDTVDSLQKLSTVDPELLKKYSKVYFLNENYVPVQLSTIPSQYVYHDDRQYSVHAQVLPYLESMLRAASSSALTVYVESAYRSFREQYSLKDGYSVIYGAGTANAFSADQGYSEHQLGTTLDFITTGLNGQLKGFEKTTAYAWLLGNAYRYGFILSYPAGNSYYIYEPWHWRFVGVKLATFLHDNHLNFYDVDQRVIDTYRGNLFDPAAGVTADN